MTSEPPRAQEGSASRWDTVITGTARCLLERAHEQPTAQWRSTRAEAGQAEAFACARWSAGSESAA